MPIFILGWLCAKAAVHSRVKRAHLFYCLQVFYDHVKALWADAGVQTCFDRAHEYQLIDSAK